MKTIRLYSIVISAILLCHSCYGTWECYNEESYKVVCSNNSDTISYYVQALIGQNVDAKAYYESNGYVCIESFYPNGAPTTYQKGSYSPQERKVLERMGYQCKSIGP